MENATEVYLQIGKDKKAPGQWLNLKTSKAFMKATKTKFKKEDDVYMMDEGLLQEYECYLKEEEIETNETSETSLMWAYATLKLKEEYVHKITDLFIQRVFGLSYSKISAETKLSKQQLLEIMNDDVKELYKMAISHIMMTCKLHKITNLKFIESEFIDFILFAESKGLRALYKVIAKNEKFTITYGKVSK